MSSAGQAGGHHALVFGASGINGWAVVNQMLLGYPDQSTFSKVTALTNRPLSHWKCRNGQSKVANVETVSRVYFFAYMVDADPAKEVTINQELLERAIAAIENLCPNLKFVVLPTGTKASGVHLLRDAFPNKDRLPLRESLPRIPEPHASEMFYYAQRDMLKSMSANKSWTFCDVIADVIIGVVPHNNIYCLAPALALYLSLDREIHGAGAEIASPGSISGWSNLSNDSSQDVVARFAIDASLHPEVTAGPSYNVADNAHPSTWSQKWPIICKYFGLKGVSPDNGQGPDPTQFVSDNREKWLEMEKKHEASDGEGGE